MKELDKLVSVPHLNQSLLYTKWKSFVSGIPVDSNKIFTETYKAWQRCVNYNINPYAFKDLKRLTHEELYEKKRQLQDVLSLLEHHFSTIKTTVSTHSSNYFICVSDQDGHLLEVQADKETEAAGLPFPFFPGICAAEDQIGNTAIGTVLVTKTPLAIIGPEHFVQAFHRWSCVGAPIFGANGEVIAVLTVGTPCGFESPYTFSLLAAAAKAVEAGLKQAMMEKQLQEVRKNLSQVIQQSEIIFNDMSQGVLILNKDCTVVFFNKAAEKIWDLSAEQIVGGPVQAFYHTCPLGTPILIRTIQEGKAFANIDCTCSNGPREKNLLVNTSVIYDENNEVSGAIGIYTDVTEIRRQDARMREQEKLAVVGQMAAGMAHEIRNPLTSVRGFAQLIKERMGDEQIPFNEYMEIMIQEIDQADSVINNFLQLARPAPAQKQLCSANELVLNFARIFESQAFLQGTKVKTDLQSIPSTVMDVNQIKQVLLNLSQNALQALKQGGTLTLATRYDPKENVICIQVIDDGPGIPPEDLDKIGTPFFTTKDKGTGLGLSISYSIVDRHRGRLEVTSKEGEGTCFSVCLPVDQQF
ncbi:ATP-binding protein [Desulforamulus ruminis]|uniref:histidine kinase n=1 Tax=Desulforamulus ruminis (strain ATCC 23193 / DSM 2154 / NCIMB 8452 / DL) TaxID=696281 RepID=F6DT75_DESRL|nr:ATP-binding protein [Desulforamulus ruminis]AEG61180.1 PAS sensor protein [Desulforamulus ruminis DSM 2154]